MLVALLNGQRRFVSMAAASIVHRDAGDAGGQFDLDCGDGQLASVFYRRAQREPAVVVDFYRTVTPPAARGRGIAEQLALHAFRWLDEQPPSVRMLLSCSYLSDRVLPKHPEFAHRLLGSSAHL